jgi:hypothetical protein
MKKGEAEGKRKNKRKKGNHISSFSSALIPRGLGLARPATQVN